MDFDPKTATTDYIIRQAQDKQDLIRLAASYAPDLAKALVGKSLISSKSVYGPIVGAGVSWFATRYGLGWDDETSATITGAVIFVVSAVLRAMTSAPITSVLPKKDTPPTE
jgi:hypothetical protein